MEESIKKDRDREESEKSEFAEYEDIITLREEKELHRLRESYCKLALNQFSLENSLRRVGILIMEWPWFDRFVIFLIACNSFFLGIMDYTWSETSGDPKPLGNQLVDNSEIYFTVFFTFECAVKVISKGLIMSENCYLRDGWNWLDFTVVITALIQNFGVTNVSSLRTFRLFRPLRSLSAVPSMKLLVNTLFLSFS